MIRKLLLAAIFLLMHGYAFGDIFVYQGDLPGFNGVAGIPSTSINFDTISTGTEIAGNTINGVTFSSPDGNTLDVVAGSDTYTDPAWFSLEQNAALNTLTPTSGLNILSPGGTDLVGGSDIRERDSLQLNFAAPIYAFGIDILFQSYDYATYTSYSVYDSSLNPIISGGIQGSSASGGAPGGSIFIGFYSDDISTDISRIVFSETDGSADYPDSNIGYDSLKVYTAQPVPVPATFLLLGSGLVGLASFRKKFKNK